MIKRILFFVLALGSLALFGAMVSAQTLLQYPIPELGFCRDAKECYLYCEIPQNKAACWSYGQFRLGPQVLGVSSISPEEDAQMRRMAAEKGITFPIAELGNCAGPAECRDFCEQEANHNACTNFAQRHGFDEGRGEGPQEAEILASARSELGCSAKEDCFRICEREHERCMAFAKKHGMYQESMDEKRYEGEKRTGPGGCDNEQSCQRYCQEHPSECPGYQEHPGQGPSQQPQGSFTSPSGCRTADECQAFCQSNPGSCPGYEEAKRYESPDSSQWCTNQAGCTWNGSYCSCPVTQSQESPPQQQYTEPVQTESQPAYSSPPDYPQDYPTP